MWPFRRHSVDVEAPEGDPQPTSEEIMNALSAVSDQLAKFIRWSYRGQKSQAEALAHLEDEVGRLRETKAVRQTALESALDYGARGMIDWLDDLDTLAQSRDSTAPFDRGLIQRWSTQLIDRLRMLGYEELEVQGSLFDARICEALGTTETWPGDGSPERYQVVAVLRRGFRHDGALFRKAQVVVYNQSQQSFP